MTFYLYRGYDHGRTTRALAIVEGLQAATKAAKRLSKQLGVICVRDCLGGLRVEIKEEGKNMTKGEANKSC